MGTFCAEKQIYLLKGNKLSMLETLGMSEYDKMERILKAFADRSRLQILDCIQQGVSNPGEIAKKLDRHRSTVEKHLRVLLTAKVVEKVPSLTESGQLSIRYKICNNATELLARIQEVCEKF
jgi:DNA-binding transcriptional ArsR family regulator